MPTCGITIRNECPLHAGQWAAVGDIYEPAKCLHAGYQIICGRGVRISDYRPDDAEDELDVVMRFLGDQRNLDRLKELRVPTAAGAFVPLSVFATLQPQPNRGDIERQDGRRYMYIKSDVITGVLAGGN